MCSSWTNNSAENVWGEGGSGMEGVNEWKKETFTIL